MPLVLYNSLTRRKEPFEPIDPGLVRMSVCAPTVYDSAHIGNGRAVVAFDLLYRVLRHTYGANQVRYVRNITDVEDKIIAAARETGEAIDALTRRTTAEFHADMAALGALPPDIEPRATAYIPQMIALIERLIAAGYAYAAEGHVLFAVASWPSYGKLARRSRDEMIAGARVEVAPYKRDPGDFVLWKPSTPDQPGWDSPWGRGRPGWHIECSAMSETELGETFDIHGRGLDLIFPHHETLNAPLAIAQLHELAGMINRATDDAERGRLQTQLRAAGMLMGILEGDPAAWLRGASDAEATGIETQIAERVQARKERRFADADR